MALVRAVPLKNFLSTGTPLSTTAVSGTSAYSTVAPVAGERLFGALHLTRISTGATLAFSVQSASSSGFGVITSELQFALTTALASTWKTLAPGASLSTDRPWRRAAWSVSSTVGPPTWNGLLWIGFRQSQ